MMNIKQQKLQLYFLEMLEQKLENEKTKEIDSTFLKFFKRNELIEIILWLFPNFDKAILSKKMDVELLKLIVTNNNILSYMIHVWKESINARPTMSQEEVSEFFDSISFSIHYLRDKPVETWDEYDVSNYYNLLFKHGKTRRVFAIYTSDVQEEDKYIVTTKPSFFFDTQEEAEEEMERYYRKMNNERGSLKIMSLWKIN